jgi:hypothetical protein
VIDGHDGNADVVAETVARQAPSAVASVAAGLARSLSELSEGGVHKANIDGHVSDPHLGPVLDTFPAVPREPLYLVEVDPAAAAS